MAVNHNLTGRDQRILRAYGTWEVEWMLTDPDAGIAHAKQSCRGGSHLRVGDDTFAYGTTAKGIELYDDGRHAVHVLTWAKIRHHALTLPPDLCDRLRAARRARRDHQASYPAWGASKEAQGCGPLPAIGPLTRQQALYLDEYQAYERERLRPWQVKQCDLNAAEQQLLDEALPLAAENAGPADLLELLAASA